jgi:hypothetical protein
MKPLKFRNGNRIANGQLNMAGSPSAPGYRQVGSDMARRADGKVLPTPQIAHGMKRVTSGALHPYLHGQPLNDESEPKLSGRNVPTHPHMQSRTQRGTDLGPHHSGKVLDAASRLSAYDKIGLDFDETHIGHKVKREASLPTNKRRLDQ